MNQDIYPTVAVKNSSTGRAGKVARCVEKQLHLTGISRHGLICIIGEFFFELRGHTAKLLKLAEQAERELQSAPQPVQQALAQARARLDGFVHFDGLYNAAGGIRTQLDGLISFAEKMKAPPELQRKLQAAAQARANKRDVVG
jgi:hypothetical protein